MDARGDPATRNQSLDGIRGLAALSVALGHCYLVTGTHIWSTKLVDFPGMSGRDIGYRLLSLPFPSDAAVMVFFVLSGYVLWQSFIRKQMNASGLPDYIISRIWRLLPLVISAILLMEFVAPTGLVETVANMLLLRINMISVTWSLQVEMIASLAIGIMWLWSGTSLGRMIAASGIAVAVVPFARHTVLVFLPAFAFGALICVVPARVWASRMLFWSGLAVLVVANLFFGHGGVARCFEIAGATAVIGCIATRPLAPLRTPLAQFLGAISYPLYLSHPFSAMVTGPIVEAMHMPDPLTTFVAKSTLSLSLAIPLAWLLHVSIEIPCMRRRPKLIRQEAPAVSM